MTSTIDSADQPHRPIAANERIIAIDTLRGVAVLGILVMNIYAFAMPFPAYGNPLLYGGSEWFNRGTWFVTHVLFDQKFMTIFSLLFGAGVIVMWRRAEQRGASFRGVFVKRQAWLAVIGAAHGYLLWVGDILFHYALVGLVVFSFRRLQPKSLIVLGCCLLVVAPLLSFGAATYIGDLRERAATVNAQVEDGAEITDEQQATLSEWAEVGKFLAPGETEVNKDLDAYRGSYADALSFRAPQVASMQTDATLFFVLWRVGGLMLIGMALLKLDVLTGARPKGFYRRLQLAGYGIGLPVMLFSAYDLAAHQWDGVYILRAGMLSNYVGSLLVAGGHIATVMLIVKSGVLSRLMARFTAVGRMALTNYLTHSIVLTTVFYGYGLGLYGNVPRAAQMLFVAAVITLQLFVSPLWLKHFRFGPVEWLWRTLTYGRLQPMRRGS